MRALVRIKYRKPVVVGGRNKTRKGKVQGDRSTARKMEGRG